MNNIIKRVWNQNRLVNIEDLTGMAFQAESGGHTFEISGIDDTGAAVELSGTVSGVFRRPDNADIALTGSASDGVVSVTLSEDCYAVPGRFGLTIFVTSNSQKVAVYACVGTVAVSSTGNVAGDTPASVEDLIEDINAAIADLNTAIGSIPADYSQFMAAIAPAYSSSALYAVGSYAWYDGDLYRCITPITTAESWTAAHWKKAEICFDLASFGLIDAAGGVYTPDLVWTSGKYINNSTNVITNGNSSLYISQYIQIPYHAYRIFIKNIVRISVGWTIAFYDSSKNFISGLMKQTTGNTIPDFYVSSIPDNAAFFVLGHYDSENQYPVGDVLCTVYAFERINEIEATARSSANNLVIDKSYKNILAGASSFADNKFINQNGYTVTNNNFCLIDGFFPVAAGKTYKLYRGEPPLYSNAGHNWTWWDENKEFLSYVLSGSAQTAPEGAAYLRFAVYISNTGSVTHETFDPSKVVITEDGKPEFENNFTGSFSARPTIKGKKWVGIGDSITEENFRATYHYWDYITAETGLSFVNMGVSGSGYKAEGSGNKAFYKRVSGMDTDADIITIFGGVNDIVLSSADIGTASDTGTTTICGCVNATIDAIEALYPANMPVGIISPLPCYCTDTVANIHPYQRPDDAACRMSQFVEQLAIICSRRGIPFLDLFHQSNLRPWHSECNAKYFSCESAPNGDGLHPNGHGHRLFYRRIMQFVEAIVMQ